MNEAREHIREYARNRYGLELTEVEIDELIERETHYQRWDKGPTILPGGFEIMEPSWDAYRKSNG